MKPGALFVDIWRGDMVESQHFGHAVVARADGEIVAEWGDAGAVIYPRSSAKILQALPLVESGAGAHLTPQQLALACASHSGEQRHVDVVTRWLGDLGLDDHALCCGPQASRDKELRLAMIRDGHVPSRVHNNCSGKHTGFLTLARHIGAPLDYVGLDNPVQVAVKQAFEEICGEDSPAYGIDGCSAPNFACTVTGLARAMARIASAQTGSAVRDAAAIKLRDAMMAHPEMVAGEGRACTELMRAAPGRFAVKTGAEGVFVGILPKAGLGIALKVVDGATRAAEIAIAALLVRLGALEAENPVAARYLNRPIPNWDGLVTGAERVAPAFIA